MLLKPIQNNYLSFQFVNLLEERLKGYRFGKHVMLLLKTILEIYFKLAALTNFSGFFFFVKCGVGKANLKLSLVVRMDK